MLSKFISSLLICSLVLVPATAPLTYAGDDEYAAGCSNPSQSGGANNTECTKAKLAKNVRNTERAKAVITLTGAAVAAAMIIVENIPIYGTAVSKPVCAALSIAVPITNFGLDIATGIRNNTVGKSMLTGLMGLAPMLITGSSFKDVAMFKDMGAAVKAQKAAEASKKAAEEAAKKGGEKGGEAAKESADKAKDKSGCAMAAVMMGLTGGISLYSAKVANKAYDTTSTISKGLYEASAGTVAPQFGNAAPHQNPSNKTKPPKAEDVVTADTSTVDSCRGGGDKYLKCLGGFSPELNRMVNDQALVDLLEKRLGGKKLGDFVKDAPYNTADLANYVAQGLGAPGAGKDFANMMTDSENDAKAAGLVEKYEPMRAAGRASVGRAPIAGDKEAAPDFEKMLADMMKSLGVDMEGAISPEQKQAMLESTFRRLDLLPPEKVEANRDISLFVRVGYRYRKNAPQLDQLH